MVFEVEVVLGVVLEVGAGAGIDRATADRGAAVEAEAMQPEAGEVVGRADLEGALVGAVEVLGDLLAVADPLAVGRAVGRGAAGLQVSRPDRGVAPAQDGAPAGLPGA